MLRQISLQVRSEARFLDIASANGVKVKVLDCKAFNRTGMTMLLELKGDATSLRAAVASIRRAEGVREAVLGEGDGDTTSLLLVLDRPAICKASNDAAIVCLECPFDSETQPGTWRFIARKSSDLRQIMAKLSREGIQTRIEDVAPLERRATLTGRQKEILGTAVNHGYFEFPRKISLTELSVMVGVKPSTLSEILRSAERRIMQNALGVPFQEESD